MLPSLDAGAEEHLEELPLDRGEPALVHRLHLGRWNGGWDQSHVQLVHQTQPKTRFRRRDAVRRFAGFIVALTWREWPSDFAAPSGKFT
jgi:hypothetical protein